jgi:hypothetical protein
MTPLFVLFKDQFGILPGAGLLGLLAIITALLGLWKMEETFGKDLNFVEKSSDHTSKTVFKPETIIEE